MFCRNCGKAVHPQAVVCPGCGVPPLIENKFCQECGAATEPDQTRCSHCGMMLRVQVPVSGEKSKVAAGLLGILLNCLGIHKFYLGYTGEGLVMLLGPTLGGILTCGISSTVFSVIGLIEGIIYLTKSDEEFEREYVRGHKGWF